MALSKPDDRRSEHEREDDRERLGREAIVLPWFQEAFANMEDHLSKTVGEMAAW